jgi:hypothetical protein
MKISEFIANFDFVVDIYQLQPNSSTFAILKFIFGANIEFLVFWHHSAEWKQIRLDYCGKAQSGYYTATTYATPA